MDGGRISLAEDACDHQRKESSIGVSILVVDDDITCLAIVSAILRKFKYKVVTVKHPKDALCTLRVKGGAFDLVVSDVHMPDMNGFELQQAIAQEFDLPVVLMSADDKESVALKGLECGAAFFIMKPVCADDLRDIWQFAAMKKKNQTVIKETPQEKEKSISDEISVSASSANEDSTNKKELRRKYARKEGSEEKNGENSQYSSQKRSKIVWTNSLHNRFLEAIRSIGLERAVPKKILEVMNVPGLSRENIASHLQKYRIFLRRVSDASYKIQSHKGLSRNLKTNCESSRSRAGEALILNPGQLPNLDISRSVVSAGQSRLLSNRGNWQKPTIQNERLTKVYNQPKPNLNLDTFPSRQDYYHSNYVGYSIRNFTPSSTDQLHRNSTGTADDNVNLDLLAPEQSRDDHRLHFAFGFGESAALSPIIDLSEFDINQNHSQQNINGGQTKINSNFYSSMVNWDNYVNVVPSQNANQHQSSSQLTYSQAFAGTSSQINGAVLLPTNEQVGEGFSNSLGFGTFTQLGRTVPSPSHERNDDDFLESLLNPYVEEDISVEDSD